uniref:Uncharacterized protein n=1 Tax=Heterosigma akashiwo TaxID=2829 RepID=A0A7S3XQI8_HETAK
MDEPEANGNSEPPSSSQKWQRGFQDAPAKEEARRTQSTGGGRGREGRALAGGPAPAKKKEDSPAEAKSRWAQDSDTESDEDEGENALSGLMGAYSKGGGAKKKQRRRRRVTWAEPVDDWGDRSKRYLFEEDAAADKEEDDPAAGGFMLGAVKSAQRMKESRERERRLLSVRGIVKQSLSEDQDILDKALKDHHIQNKQHNILSALHQLIDEEDEED